jgi:hypothetical protein
MIDFSKMFSGKFSGGHDRPQTQSRRESTIHLAQLVEEDNTVDEDESIVLRDDTGILFCEEILRVSNGLSGLLDTFSKIDCNGNGYISLYELAEYLKKLGMELDLNEVKAIHKYLSGILHPEEGYPVYCVVSNCPERVEELVRNYELTKKAFFFSTRSSDSAIPDSQRYFQRFDRIPFKGT